MIKLIPDLPANIVGLIASGHRHGRRLRTCRHSRGRAPHSRRTPASACFIRCPRTSTASRRGAVWDDVKMGMGHYHRVGTDRGRDRRRMDPRFDALFRVRDAVPGEAVRQSDMPRRCAGSPT
jgi:hypothetical protein